MAAYFGGSRTAGRGLRQGRRGNDRGRHRPTPFRMGRAPAPAARRRGVSLPPLPVSYALVPKDGRPIVFIDHRKLSNSARDHLEQTADVEQPDALTPKLTELARSGASIALDSATAADALSRLISGAGGKPVRGNDPVSLLKAVKNVTEIEGTRKAHRRDAVALVRFLAWIDREAPSGALTEIDRGEALAPIR